MNELVMATSCAPSGLTGWLGTIIFGAVIGVLARAVLPGKQSISMAITVVIGVIGALLGYWLSGLLGVCATSGIDWTRWLISIVVAAVLVVAYGAVTGKKA
jgi:uncharacterized membrane protein YeaQ/YmgE (transglycosylase-associated protein family)